MNSNSQKHFLQEIAGILELLRIATESEFYLQDLVGRIGWDLDEVSGFSLNQLSQHLHSFTVNLQQFAVDLEEKPPETLDDFKRALENVEKLYDDIRGLKAVFESPDLINTPQLKDFVKDLIEFLTITYVRNKYPVLYHLAVLLTIIQDSAEKPFSEPVFDGQGKLVRFPHRRPQLRLDRLADLLTDPVTLLSQEYFSPNELNSQEDAIRASYKLFPRLDALLSQLGFNTVFSYNRAYGIDFGKEGNRLAAGMLTIFWESDIEDLDFGMSLAFSPREHGGLGLVVIPFGSFEFSQVLNDWNFNIGLTAGIQALAIGSQGFTLLAEPDIVGIEARFSALKLAEVEGATAFFMGSTQGTRLEVSRFQFSGLANLSENEVEVGLLSEANSATLIISPGDGDGFLQKILPSEGVRADFDLAIGWSNKKGFYLRGSAGLEASLPIQVSLFGGVLTIDSIYLAIKTDGRDIQSILAASIGTQIGPVQAVIDRVGLEAIFTFPEQGGNLGPLDLSLAFKTPTGIGLSIDAEGITGSGFLRIDPPNYAGMMQLSYKNEIDLTAFGLITTKLPDGKDGFSLVIQIMAEFQPMQIGLGFALTGVGGLIGINRQINEDGLKAAFKTHSLDAILFPQSPIRDAVKIIGALQSIMPPREGYHILGPMAKLFWGGSMRLIEFEVGVFIQLGGPLKIAILGRAWSHLPRGDSPRLVINVDVLGILDLGEERLAIDAVLYDSRILKFTLDGKMALRADWSSGEENFALSVGGFHPRFQAIPPGFPQLSRLLVAVGSDNPKLTLSLYLAITPNTLQIGAHVDLWAKKLGLTITGGAGFDALFTFSPFSFLIVFNVWVNIRGWIDLGVWLELELSGPNPIVAAGYAKFKIGWFTKKIRFRKEFGEKISEPLPAVSPLAALIAELGHPRSIRFQLPAWASANLVFTKDAEAKIDPIADVIIIQNAVPLNFTLERFGGSAPPETEQRLSLTANLDADREKAVQSLFAPEQFKNWTADERLSARPFEKYDAGIRFSGEYVIPEDHLEEREIVFETVLRESKTYREQLPKSDYRNIAVRTTCLWQPEVVLLANWSLFGSQSYYKPLRRRREESHPNYVKVAEPGFNLSMNEAVDGKFVSAALDGVGEGQMTYAEALEVSKQIKDAQILIRSKVYVMPT